VPGARYARVGGQPPGGFGAGAQANAQAQQVVAWLRAHQPGSTYLLAVQGSSQAGEYILAGASVLPMDGFSGQVPFPTNDQLATLVADGQLRYVLLGGRGGPGGEGNSNFTGKEHLHGRQRRHVGRLRSVRLRTVALLDSDLPAPF